MGKKLSTKNIKRLFRRLWKNRWFSAMTASGIATIIGIVVTFGVDSCLDNRRVRQEMQKSMLQAIDNIGDRLGDAQAWVDIIENQFRVYHLADSIHVAGGELPDNVCMEFRYTMPYIKMSAFDHEFERIFRGSYQLWQMRNKDDSLSFYIGQCYDGLNTVETACQNLTEGMIEQIGKINASKHFHRLPPREWTLTLLDDAEFQFYMSVRRAKTAMTADILNQTQNDYDTNVVPRGNKLKEK